MADVVLSFNETLQSGATGTGDGTVMDVGGLGMIAVQVTGIVTATITMEGTLDGSNWESLREVRWTNASATATITADGIYQVVVAGLDQIRARISAYTDGTITVLAKGVINGQHIL